MFTYDPREINGIIVMLLAVNVVAGRTTYMARGPLHDYFVIKRSTRRFDVESYNDDFIDEASTLEEACQIIMECEEGRVPW